MITVVGRAAIAQANVQQTIWPKRQHAAVVIGGGVGNPKQNLFAVWIAALTIGGQPITSRDAVVVGGSIVEIKHAAGGEIGRKSQAQQALFIAAVVHPFAHIQKQRTIQCANRASLFDHVQATTVVARVSQKHRLAKPFGDWLQAESACAAAAWRSGGGGGCNGGGNDGRDWWQRLLAAIATRRHHSKQNEHNQSAVHEDFLSLQNIPNVRAMDALWTHANGVWHGSDFSRSNVQINAGTEIITKVNEHF